MAKVQVQSSWRKKLRESDVLGTLDEALTLAMQWKRAGKCKTIVVLRDSEGTDHPSNAGKFFLEQIVK